MTSESNFERELRHLKEQNDMQEFLNRPSLRMAKERAWEKEAEELLFIVY